MSQKKLKFDLVVFWFLFVPLICVVFSFVLIRPTLQYSLDPLSKIASYKTPNDVYSVLQIRLQNLTNQNSLTTLPTTWEVSYNIMTNSSRQPSTFSLVEILPGWSGFSVPLKDYPSDNSTYYFQINGEWMWFDYRTWSWKYSSSVTFQWKSVSSFPIDTFESPVIYVWTSDAIYPNIELDAPSMPGFVVTLKPIGPSEPLNVYRSESISSRMGIGLPAVTPYGFQIVIQRDLSSITLYLLYFFSVFLIVYYIGGFSQMATDVEKRMGILATLSISVIAFVWTLRQIAGSITYIEGILLLELFVFVVFAILGNTDLSPLKNFVTRINKRMNSIQKCPEGVVMALSDESERLTRHEDTKKLMDWALQTIISWSVVMFTIFLGLVGLLPQIELYPGLPGIGLTAILIILYAFLILAFGYSIRRIGNLYGELVNFQNSLPEPVKNRFGTQGYLGLIIKNGRPRRTIVFTLPLMASALFGLALILKILILLKMN